jgi:hypothetical protein
MPRSFFYFRLFVGLGVNIPGLSKRGLLAAMLRIICVAQHEDWFAHRHREAAGWFQKRYQLRHEWEIERATSYRQANRKAIAWSECSRQSIPIGHALGNGLVQPIFSPPSRRSPFVFSPSLSRRDAGLEMLCVM